MKIETLSPIKHFKIPPRNQSHSLENKEILLVNQDKESIINKESIPFTCNNTNKVMQCLQLVHNYSPCSTTNSRI